MKLFATILLLGLAATAAAQAAATTNRFYGYAYDLKTAKYLYTELHEQRIDGDRWFGGSIQYYAPDGSLLASKTLDFTADPYIPVFKLEIPKEGYVEAITKVTKDSFTMEKVSHGKTEMETMSRAPGMAADSGFHSAIVDHFDDLRAGKPLKFKLGVAGELDTFSFRCSKIADVVVNGRPAIKFRVELDSLLSLLAGPLEIVYDVQTRHLLDYRGVSNIHDPATGEAYNVHIVYTDKPPADAPKNLPPL
ncbi:MAG: hypothetical protein NVS9B10_10870 [Nevskia sp.]